MKLVIAAVISLAGGIGTTMWKRKIGYSYRGQYQCDKARERGDITIGKRVSKVRYDARTTGEKIHDKIYYRCVYEYSVDGAVYEAKMDISTAPDTIEICYDRRRANRWIDPDDRSLADKLWGVSVPILFVVLLFILV